MSGSELRPIARDVLEAARAAQTPSDAHRERAYRALMVGLGAGASAAPAKMAGKATLTWLKWAAFSGIFGLAGVAAIVWAEHRHPTANAAPSAAPAMPTVLAVPPQVDEGASAKASASAAPEVKLTASPPLAKPVAGDLGDELSLLHRALAESRSGNAARALELARQHARLYPSSKLGIERDAIEVRSLCTLGRAADAHKIADRLRTQAPNSPVSAALAETCVGK